MIKNFLKYIWLLAVVAAFASCSIDEIDRGGSKGTVKFVVKPSNFMSSYVSNGSTKAASDIFENKIINAHFLLFDSAGNLMFSRSFEDVTDNTIPTQELDLDFQTGKVTACFIANVPTSIVNGFSKLSDVNAAILELDYFSERVLDSENNPSFFAVPLFDLKGDGNTVKCLPMLGMTECNLDNSRTFEIPLKRLFAKVSMNITVGDLSLTNLTQSFDIIGLHLINLPVKVKLTEPTGESAWVKVESAFLHTQIEAPVDDDKINSTTQSSYEFYFYVPEYYLYSTDDKSGNYGNQKFKPNMYDKDKYPIYVRMFGKYKGSATATEQGVTYDLYLGENASASFTLKRNKHYKNFIKIKGITNSIDGSGTTLDCRVVVDELDEVEIMGQSANCYVIGATGSYLYPAYKGTWKKTWGEIPSARMCTKGTTLKVLYQDNSSIKLSNLAFNKETCEISFDVSSVDGGGGFIASNDGNVIIGLVYTENGKEVIEWSWHLWVVTGAIWGVEAFEINSEKYPNGGYMMDRNLGAKVTALQQTTPGVALGLYYKYGRKEPFFSSKKDYIGGGELEKYSWVTSNNSKSQTDPCPPGYRVPPTSMWDGDATKKHSSLTTGEGGEAFLYWDQSGLTDDIYYPYSGYLDAGNNPKSQGYGTRDTTSNYKVDIPANQTDLNTTTASNYSDNLIASDGGTGPVRFTNVKYAKYDINNLGIVLATNREVQYGYKEKGIDIISCTVQIGKWKRSGSILSRKWNVTYSAAENLTGAQLKSKYGNAYNRLLSVIDGDNGSNTSIAGSFLTGIFTDPTSFFEYKEVQSTLYGYQIRCMKE